MLRIYTENPSPRIKYVLDFVFKRHFSIGFEYTQDLSEAHIIYSKVSINQDYKGIYIPGSGILSQSDAKQSYTISRTTIEGVEDYFGLIFYCISGYEFYNFTRFDVHGRYKTAEMQLGKIQGYTQPIVNDLLDLIAAKLAERFNLNLSTKYSFSAEVTFDIDHPWRYAYKDKKIEAGGVFKNLLNLDTKELGRKFAYEQSGVDPYDVYELMEHATQQLPTTLFYLGNRTSEFDNRHPFSLEPYQHLINDNSRWSESGIHPSYHYRQNTDRLNTELNQLKHIDGKIVKSRLHFLRYEFPYTFRHANEAGIQEEYSLGLLHEGHYPLSYNRPVKWFDVANNKATDLLLKPAALMDRSLQKYMHLSGEEAAAKIKKVLAEYQQREGHFILILHNETLSEIDTWKGWRAPMLAVIKEMNKAHAGEALQ